MSTGKILRLVTDKGYGFIGPMNSEGQKRGEDTFFHLSGVAKDAGITFEEFQVGDIVEFEKGPGRDGRIQAFQVRRTELSSADEETDYAE